MLKPPPILRPRWTWRYVLCSIVVFYLLYCFLFDSPLFASRLPRYSGPYSVGTIDVESPCDGRVISDFKFKDSGESAFNLDTVLFSLYYPTSLSFTTSKPHHYWIPKPVSLTAEGYLRFGHVNNFITNALTTFGLWMVAGGITIPAKVDVPLHESALQFRALTVENERVERNVDQFPVLIFSHGYASSRTDYTHYLGELASRGYVVAAIEHRDGSGPASTVMRKGEKSRDVFPMRIGDMIHDPSQDDASFKQAQLSFREAEVEETVRVLRKVNEGKGHEIFELNPRNEGQDLRNWAGRLDMSQITMSGHSFGATLALQCLRGSPDSPTRPFKGGIILDPGKSSGPLNTDITVPILIIHSNSWSKTHSMFYGRPHFSVVRDLVSNLTSHGVPSWFVTSLGTSHPSVTDAPLLEPLLLSWTTGATINARQGVGEYVLASEEFLGFLKTGKREGLLGLPVTHAEYDVPVPNEEGKKRGMSEEEKRWRTWWQVHVAPSMT